MRQKATKRGPDGCGLSVAYGIQWLGCETAQSKVLYVNLEIQRSFAQRRFKTLADAKGVIQEAGRLDVWNLRGSGSCREVFRASSNRIRGWQLRVHHSGQVYKLYADDDDENSERAMAARMKSIEQLAVETGAGSRSRLITRRGIRRTKRPSTSEWFWRLCA